MAASRSDYVLGMAPEEIARLEHQHATWRSSTERVWDAAGIGPGQTVVDLGCGPGFTTVDLAGRVGPGGRVIAVDTSQAALDHLMQMAADRGFDRVEVALADVAEIDLARWQPDAVTARWLFWFLPGVDAIIRRIGAALAPGAVFAVMDYANYLAIDTEPSSADFRRVFEAVHRSCEDAGGSLDVAGRLPAMLDAAGFDVIAVESLTQVGRPGSDVWAWVSSFQRLHVPALADKGYLKPGDLAALRRWWQSLEARPQSLFFAPPMLGVVGVKR